MNCLNATTTLYNLRILFHHTLVYSLETDTQMQKLPTPADRISGN